MPARHRRHSPSIQAMLGFVKLLATEHEVFVDELHVAPAAQGKKGAAAPAATEAAPAADCSFSCFWRVEPDFMDVSLERCHPLAVRYFGSAFRDEARGRQMLWRAPRRGMPSRST